MQLSKGGKLVVVAWCANMFVFTITLFCFHYFKQAGSWLHEPFEVMWNLSGFTKLGLSIGLIVSIIEAWNDESKS